MDRHAFTTDLSPQSLRTAFAHFPSGVAAVAAIREGVPVGMAVSSFTTVSLEPALVSISVAQASSTWPTLRAQPEIGISVLAHHHGPAARALSAKGTDRFASIDWASSPSGSVFISGSALGLDCVIEGEFPAGDHAIVLLRISQFWADAQAEPLVFHGSEFRRLDGGGTVES
jgi:flavin reductase (DIM6/NTAB) family NADH-FMN oxidoreductase RutF